MSLTIVAGLPGAGRQRHTIEALSGAARDTRSALLITPTAADAASTRSYVAEVTPVGFRVGTLDGTIRREWALRGDGRTFLDAFPADLLATRALREAGVSEAPGRGAVALLRAISSRHASAGTAERMPAAAGLPGRLLAALRSYVEALREHGLIEPEAAAANLVGMPAPADLIGVTGFTSFTPAEERLLVSWADRARVFIELPWDEGVAGTAVLQPLVERLVAAGATVTRLAVQAGERSPELSRIAGTLFAGGPAAPTEGSVRLGLAQGDEAEARCVARFVADAIERGATPESICIAFPDLARHSGWVVHELRDSQIPVVVDIDSSVPETPFGRALLRLWAFCARGMGREDLTAFLRSPFSGAGLAHADRTDATARRRGLSAGPEVLGLAGTARSLVDMCRHLTEKHLDPSTVRKWKSLADELLANAYPGNAPVLASDAVIDAAAHRVFAGLLEQALTLAPGTVTPEELMHSYELGRVRSRAEPTPGCVIVTSLNGLARGFYDHAVIGGLNASEFPRRGTDERMQGDAVGRVVAMLDIAPDPEEHARSERLAFYLAVTAPRRSLDLVRRESDDEGNTLRESVFWDEFLDLYRSPGEGAWPSTGPVLERVDVSERRSGNARRARGLIADARVLEYLADIECASPSAIEAYNACPYRWFVERRLNPKAPDVSFDRMAAGSLAHAALALFNERIVRSGERVTPQSLDRALELARECYLDVLPSAPHPVGLEEQRLQADVWPSIVRTVTVDATILADFAPAHAEWSFGLEEGDPPVDLGGVALKGRADRIDIGPQGLVVTDYKLAATHSLADIERRGLLQLQLYAAAASQRLGVPVAGGIYRSLRTGEARGFVCRGAGSGFKSGDVVDTARIEELLESAMVAARAAVIGMRAGSIAPRPDRERCSYCAAAPFCPEAVS